MAIEAKAWVDWPMQRVRVVVRDTESGMIFGPTRQMFPAELEPGVPIPEDLYVIDFPDRFTDAVLQALNEAVRGEKAPGDAYALRRDLEHERGRTDKLIDVVVEAFREVPRIRVVDFAPPGASS